MMKLRSLAWCWMLAAVGCVVPEHDDLVSVAAYGGTTYPAIADSWVRSGSSVKSNKGRETILSADRVDSGSAERRIYFQFEVPDGVEVAEAHVQLYCTRGSDRGGELRTTSTSWTELGLTWANQPALGPIVDARGSVKSGTWIAFDVSSVVTGPGRYAFALTTPSSQEVRYDSRETTRAPRLVVTPAEPDPAPDAGTPTPDAPDDDPAPPSDDDYILIRRADLMALPTTSSAFSRLKNHADATWPAPDLADQDRKHGTYVLAAAMVYARTGITSYRDKARAGIMAAIGTENDASTRTLSVGRQLGAYVLAADFIRLDGTDDATFRSWLSALRTREFPAHGRWISLEVTHEDSANNWGAWAGAALIATARYLGDTEDLERRVRVVKGFLGDRTQWNDFRGQDEKNGVLGADERAWACNDSPTAWLPTNGTCSKNGVNLDGAFPSDASRGGPVQWPVPSTGVMYHSETVAAMLIQLELLYQAGYDLWSYRQNAMRRAGDFLARSNGWNNFYVNYGNSWLANRRLGTSYPQLTPTASRMLIGYDWLWGP